MSNPATRVTTALTYMQGNMMEPWKEEQMTKLEARITRGVADTKEIHWTEFKQAFKDSVMVRSLCLSVILVLEFSDRGISQIGSRPDVSIRKSS